jgi:hypothetical protein
MSHMTSGWGASFGNNSARGFIARLILILFALRAVVPVGYMPDLGALEHGQVRIVVCTGAGFKSLLVDEAGRPVDAQESGTSQHAGADCPFGTAAAKAFLAPTLVAALALPTYEQHILLPGSGVALLPPAQGPPLGPRAPPTVLG